MKKKKRGVTLGKLEGKVDGLTATVDGLATTVDGLTTTVNGLTTTVNGLAITVKELSEMLGFVVERMVTKDDLKGFATKEDLKRFATKDDLHEGLFTLQTQMNGIESDIREMKHARLEVRVADLEEKVFGKAR